jgi:hypothetical protein
VVLAEGLRRCPWEVFSGSRARGWEITTHVALAAAFVQAAYTYALERTAQLASEPPTKGQASFLDLLRTRDPREILAADEEQVLEKIDELFQAPPRLNGGRDPLVRATRAYLESQACRAVSHLVASLRPPPPSKGPHRRPRRR